MYVALCACVVCCVTDRMKVAGITPNQIVFTSAMEACAEVHTYTHMHLQLHLYYLRISIAAFYVVYTLLFMGCMCMKIFVNTIELREHIV